MPFFFKDIKDNLSFEFYGNPPTDNVIFNKRKSNGQGYLKLSILQLYGLYRNAVFDSYRTKPDLAQDIKDCKMQYPEKSSKFDHGVNQGLYQYSVKAVVGAMKEWQNSDPKIACIVAYENNDGKRKKVGFVHFVNKKVDNKKVVYIEQMGVATPGKSIGRRLMELVLWFYPAGKEFQVGTRIFNTEAKTLYQNRLHFTPVGLKELKEIMDLDARYCGFKKITTADEIADLHKKIEIRDMVEPEKTQGQSLEMKEEGTKANIRRRTS